MKPFQNIFTKKSNEAKTPNPKTPIIIDTREKQSLVSANLLEQKANIKFEKLEIADYLINNIAIERKTFSDFISSMINKRLMAQLQEIKKYPKHFLIIEGKQDTENPNLKKAATGMVLSIITDFNIPIIFTKNQQETSEILILLAKKQEKPKTQISLRPQKSALSLKQQKQFILEGFPGIGPTISKELLKNFKSLRQIFNASKEQLRTITKLNENKIEKFMHLLGS